MTVRIAQAMKKAHTFALWHRKRLDAPDKAAFYADWHRFTERLKERGDDWTDLEFAIMLAYATAALHYDDPVGHRVPDWEVYRRGGLWRQQWGNVGEQEEAA